MNDIDAQLAKKISALNYYTLCFLVELVYVIAGTSLIGLSLTHHIKEAGLDAGVFFILGAIAAGIFAANADKSSWHPLRDIQTTE